MAPDCSCGTSFHLSTHLWIVIAELPTDPPEVVIVNVTTKRQGSDETVILKVGDHRFLKHDSVISYADARRMETADLINRIDQRYFHVDEPFSEEILKRIQQGLLDSPFTERSFKKACQGLIP